MKKILTIIIIFISINCFAKDKVILIHGLGRTERSMRKLSEFLSEFYDVHNLRYSSTKYKIEEISQNYVKPYLDSLDTQNGEKIHFVTHSLGGIILRYFLQNNKLDNLGRIVLLSPPNKGSEVADFLADTNIMGPALKQLKTDSLSFVNNLPPFPVEFGVLTGSRSFNWINSIMIKGKDDGKVSIEKSKLFGMNDFRVVEHTHAFIMNAPEVQIMIINFFERGKFIK